MTTAAHRPVRWGILATGGIADAFAQDLRLLGDEAELVAVGSRTAESARRFADRHGIPRAHGTWQDLADDPDVDVVYVATPHSAHHAAASLCLEAGRAVLCEKPFTLNLAQAQDLVTLARRRELFLMEAMWMYVNPTVRRIRDLVADGAVGEVRSVHADFGIAVPYAAAHRLHDPAQGGGALLDLGVYPVAFAQLLLGAPDDVSARAHLNPQGVDENTGILLGYDSGAVANLSCSLTTATSQYAAVNGTRGRIVVARDFFHPDGFVLHRDGHDPEEVRLPADPGNGYTHEAREVVRCLRAGATESELVPLDGTLSLMATLDNVRDRIGVHYPGE
ncbi:Gfo/Idh/MocA family oxidoreductase [Streptacidiphilus sp. ASG 303]|uniref:Gfo/Idh/MocA family protein n=1 Tax=Streptacidiphilus sp. ASG 303 TaxID=2896847 RepID=UPI001E5E17A9|nr:Gfo/Idh/MocA family oxidoreductase [Streptacidiphilus sp. ASG 303]MCD0482925.1 Gfo/Idh/MocA family oxidoreductase [Streptacidiphilus sp. ASG 303]